MPLRTATLTLLALLLGTCACPSALLAQQPYYYPAYGAHRGRISYHQGPFGGTRQKIRWGGGITDNGAAVILGAIDAAGPILSSVLGGRSLEEDAGQRALRDAEHQRALDVDQSLLEDARRASTAAKELLAQFRGSPPAPANQPPSSDSFNDWDSESGASPPVGNSPVNGSRFNLFADWDSERSATALADAGSPQRESFRDWDNR